MSALPEARSAKELKEALPHIAQSPADAGELCLIVSRPDVDQRQELESAQLHPEFGLEGDSWSRRATVDPQCQLTLMNARVAQLVAGERRFWSLAGDQLYVDLDLSLDNLPPGTRLSLGEAEIEVSSEPHTGCQKFVERFGHAAMIFVNSATGQRLNLRGINARVCKAGRIACGDRLRKLPAV